MTRRRQLLAFGTNILSWLKGRPHRIASATGPGLWQVRTPTKDGGEEILYFSRWNRHRRYKHGISERAARLAQVYHLEALTETLANGSFLDCGANVGELGIWARQNGMHYVAFEPEALEARCVDLNNFEGRAETHRIALWHQAETLEFYSDPRLADSSLFKPSEGAVAVPVAAAFGRVTMLYARR